MAGKRRIDHEQVAEFKRQHPEMKQSEIGDRIGLSQKQVSRILCEAGIECRKGCTTYYRKSGQTDEEFYWEKRLVQLNLGMERGTKINDRRILYGAQDGSSYEVKDDFLALK